MQRGDVLAGLVERGGERAERAVTHHEVPTFVKH